MPDQIKGLLAFTSLLLGAAVTLWPDVALSQAVRSREEAQRILVIENLSAQDGVVSGEVHNRSDRTVRDVQLFIRHTWLWDDEFHPGKVDPGASTFHTLPQEISPGGMARFNFTPSPPLAKAAGGRFVTTVSVAGFTEIVPQTK
jgi:hypothetical protein